MGGLARISIVLSVAVAASAGCLESSVDRCANGRVCGGGWVCDDVHDMCVREDQLHTCDGLDELDTCEIGGAPVGICHDGVCLDAVCGDGVVTGLEECDGDDLGEVDDCGDLGYRDPGPVTCDASCRYQTTCTRRCGDGILDPEEQCDVGLGERVADCRDRGYYDAGDVTCTACVEDVTGCTGRCGDGIVNGTELCDGEGSIITCLDLGFEAGRIGCASCGPDFTDCRHIGWLSVPALSTTGWNGLSSPAPGELIAVGGNDTALHVSGGAVSLTQITGAVKPQAVWASSATDVHAVDIQGRFLHYDGAWTVSVPGSPLRGIAGAAPDDLWAVGDDAQIHHHDGVGWSLVYSGSGSLRAVWSDTGATIGVGQGGQVVRRSGETWIGESVGLAELYGVWGSSETDVFAVGVDGTIAHRDAQGWQNMASGTTAHLRSVWGRAPDEVFAAGSSGTVVRYDGASWWPLDVGTAMHLVAITGNAEDVFVAGDAGTLLRQEGASWARPETLTDFDYEAVAIGPDGSIVAAGTCSITARGVAGWIDLGQPCTGIQGYQAVWAGPGGAIVAVEFGGEVRRFDGVTWAVDPAGSAGTFGVSGVWGTAADDVYAVSFDGVIHWDGAAWTPTGAPFGIYNGVHGTSANDVFAVGASSLVHFDGDAWTETNGFEHGLNDVWAAAPDDVWAVGDQGSLVHYDGSTWTDAPSPTSVTLRGVAGGAADDVWAVGDGNTLLHYDGVGWSEVASPLPGDAVLGDVAVRDDLVIVAADWDLLLVLLREASW